MKSLNQQLFRIKSIDLIATWIIFLIFMRPSKPKTLFVVLTHVGLTERLVRRKGPKERLRGHGENSKLEVPVHRQIFVDTRNKTHKLIVRAKKNHLMKIARIMCIPRINIEIWEIIPPLARMKNLEYQRLVSLSADSLIFSATMLYSLHSNKTSDLKATPNSGQHKHGTCTLASEDWVGGACCLYQHRWESVLALEGTVRVCKSLDCSSVSLSAH